MLHIWKHKNVVWSALWKRRLLQYFLFSTWQHSFFVCNVLPFLCYSYLEPALEFSYLDIEQSWYVQSRVGIPHILAPVPKMKKTWPLYFLLLLKLEKTSGSCLVQFGNRSQHMANFSSWLNCGILSKMQ